MRATKNLLLFIGSVALFASFFRIVNGGAELIDTIFSVVCGTSLILGYIQLNKADKPESKC